MRMSSPCLYRFLKLSNPFHPCFLDVEPKREPYGFKLAPAARPRVPSNARRTALGWSKHSIGGNSSTDQKKMLWDRVL